MVKVKTLKECFDEWVKSGRKKDYGHDFTVHEIRMEFYQHQMKMAERMYRFTKERMCAQLNEWQSEFPEHVVTYEGLVQECEKSHVG